MASGLATRVRYQPENRGPRSPVMRRTITAVVLTVASVGVPTLWASPAGASPALAQLVSDHASAATPRVLGGQCYPGVKDPSACRRVLAITQLGKWIYVGGIISDVYDPGTGRTVGGFHNLFRFDARTHLLDATFKPQLYRTTSTYRDAAVTALAGGSGGFIYAAGAFTTVASAPGQPGLTRRGVAGFSTANGAVRIGFDARIAAGGGPGVVNDVKNVNGSLWLGGSFTHVGRAARAALASVSQATGARTRAVTDTFSGRVTLTAPVKVQRIAVNPQHTKAAVIGNFAEVDGATHKDVVLLHINAGVSTGASTWNAPTYLNASQKACEKQDTWARGVDWDPTGTYFDIAASGGGGFDAFPALCDAFTRFLGDNNSNATPRIVNYTGFDSLLTVCDTGDYVYTGGHNKHLDHALYINGNQVSAGGEQTHYGIGVISVNPHSPTYGQAVKSWNNSTLTGRGAGWAACRVITGGTAVGGGVYMGGDGQKVNGNTAIKRLAYFPGA